jgi:diamine N-acetyltransferase
VSDQIELRPVDADNVRAICELRLAPGQERYVAPAAYTVAEAAYDPEGWLRAIYLGETPVGVVYVWADKLVRLMVDVRHQRRGIGQAVIPMIADELRRLGEASHLYTSYTEGPDEPRGFYLAQGFDDTGTHDEEGERVLVMPL